MSLQAGDVIKRPALADTLEEIGSQGADAFYSGRIAESIVEAVSATIWHSVLDKMFKFKLDSNF